jgi:hypothetical protein
LNVFSSDLEKKRFDVSMSTDGAIPRISLHVYAADQGKRGDSEGTRINCRFVTKETFHSLNVYMSIALTSSISSRGLVSLSGI